MKLQKKFIWPILLIGLLITSAVVFNDRSIQIATQNTNYNQNQQNINENTDITNSNIDQNSNFSTDNRQPIGNGLRIPILMYHHIRDFNDPTDKIGTNLSVSPTDFVAELDKIKERGYTTITFQDVLKGDVPEKSIILTFDDGYENFYQNAYPELKNRGMTAVSYIIVGDIGKGDYMTSAQIAEIDKYGIEIGSHTLSHPDLSTATETRATREVTDSKAQLETIVGKPIISFCYPSGKFTDATELIVKNAGYSFAVTTQGGITTFGDTFALNRYRVNNGTSIDNWIK